MRNEYRVGPIYHAGLIVSGGMCAGLGIAILVAQALHRTPDIQLLHASVPTPPAAALGFAACGLALIGVGLWFPRITSVGSVPPNFMTPPAMSKATRSFMSVISVTTPSTFAYALTMGRIFLIQKAQYAAYLVQAISFS